MFGKRLETGRRSYLHQLAMTSRKTATTDDVTASSQSNDVGHLESVEKTAATDGDDAMASSQSDAGHLERVEKPAPTDGDDVTEDGSDRRP